VFQFGPLTQGRRKECDHAKEYRLATPSALKREEIRYIFWMRKNDARKLDHKTLEELRIRVVKRVQDGESPEGLAKALDLERSTVYGWPARYRQGGWNRLKAKPLAGCPPRLDRKKMRWVYDMVTRKNPQQLNFSFALWMRDIITKLIKDKFAMKLSAASVGRLLGRLGTTCQEPLRSAQELDDALAQQWLKKESPQIRATAPKADADIYFGDTTQIHFDHHAGRTWRKKGEAPILETTGAQMTVWFNAGRRRKPLL
jgi:transposase